MPGRCIIGRSSTIGPDAGDRVSQHRQRRWLGMGRGDNYYFRNFSEKIAYPLAINTLFYVMTH
jgi:hypothetical protein